MEKFSLRKAKPEDVDTILRLIALLAEYEKEPEAAIATKDDILRYGFGDTPLFYCIIAEIDDRAVGFALYFLTFSTWQGKPGVYLEDLFVLPEYRGNGIGKSLMKGVAEHGVEMGCTRMTWQVLDWNTPSIDFYEQLGARDTLRLEKGYCLYGNDIDNSTNPIEAGLGWITKIQKGEFNGKEAIVAMKTGGAQRKLVGFTMQTEKLIPRQHYKIMANGAEIGEITSGNISPLLNKGIGMGYVATEFSAPGTMIEIIARNTTFPAEVTKVPFL